MKHVIRGLLIFFFCLFGTAFFIQTPLAKNLFKNKLISYAQANGISLTIEAVNGTLPFNWTLQGVACHYREEKVTFDSIRFRFAVFPLLKRELHLSYLKAEGGSYNDTHFTVLSQGRWTPRGLKLTQLLIEGDDLFIRLEGKWDNQLSLKQGHLAYYVPEVGLFPQLKTCGCIMGMAQVTKTTAHFECLGDNLILHQMPLSSSTLTLEAKRNKGIWEGQIKLSGGLKELPLEGAGRFSFHSCTSLAVLEYFQLKGENIECFGKLDADLATHSVEGEVFANCLDLKILRPLFPGSFLKGCGGARLDFQSFSNIQDVKCQMQIEDFKAYDTSCKSLVIEGAIFDLFQDPSGEFTIEGQDLTAHDVELSNIEIKSIFEPQASPIEFSLKGKWDDPLEITGQGHWQKGKEGLTFNLERFEGVAFNKPFSLTAPLLLEYQPHHLKMTNLSFDIAQGHIAGRIDLSKTTTLIKIKADAFPLEFISFPKQPFSLSGTGYFDIDVVAWDNHVQGNCNIALQRAHFFSKGTDTPVTTKGSLQLHLTDQSLQVHGEIKSKDLQFIHFFGTIPVSYSHFPFLFHPQMDQPFSAQLVSEGKLEDLFNFINIGHHRIEGWLSNALNFSGTLQKPMIQGNLELQNGLYENYYTGTHLHAIDAKATAHKHSILIDSLSATDGGNGLVSGTGNILLSPAQHFPFSITAQLTELDTVSFDTMSGKFSGEVTISGNQQSATAKGKLKVSEATFRIPDELPSVLPELPITFINPPESLERGQTPQPSGSPLQLDLDLEVPSQAFVTGRGLNAELKGNLSISGTYTDIIAKGTLQLVKGEFLFAGKVFDLTQGELVFNDKPTPSAYISLIGECELPEVNVSAILRGPLSRPKLSFQSSPQLPTSSLLARILFNEDISQISAIQALQLAQTVISLSGSTAPDILEKIRKTLGIDRLTLVNSESDPQKVSLQIGKYLMKGVLLTLSQGAESRNLSVEVDLKKGIKLQAEVNETQQGKFSLKWHHHY